MNILQINSSIFGAGGQSTQLADRLVSRLRKDGAQVTVRDLTRDPMPYLTASGFGAFLAKPEERTGEQKAVADFSDRLIEELRQADVIVLGAPMYNGGIPAQLKSWVDHVSRAGVTFRYTEKGPVGLLTGKKAYVLSSRGGIHVDTPHDNETPHVRGILGLLGIVDVEFIYAEGLNMGEAPRDAAIRNAHAAIDLVAVTEDQKAA